jgi:hypothetical protein
MIKRSEPQSDGPDAVPVIVYSGDAGTPLRSSPPITPQRAEGCCGLFVPKPSTDADCQRGVMPDLEQNVRQRPLAFTADDGDCYSLGYSARVHMPGASTGGMFRV